MINYLKKIKLDNIKLDNKKIILILLVCLVILYIDFASFIKLQLHCIKTLTPKILNLKKDIHNLTKDLSAMEDLEQRQTTDKKQIEASKLKEIISEDQIALLLQGISDIANKNKIRVMQINTIRDIKVQEEVIGGQKLLPITITLDLSCTYHLFGSFINDLEKAGQFIDLQNMKIMRDPNDCFIEDVNLVLKTYVKK